MVRSYTPLPLPRWFCPRYLKRIDITELSFRPQQVPQQHTLFPRTSVLCWPCAWQWYVRHWHTMVRRLISCSERMLNLWECSAATCARDDPGLMVQTRCIICSC